MPASRFVSAPTRMICLSRVMTSIGVEDSSDVAAADLVPISPPCWQPSLEVRAWSNVLCAWRDDDLAVLHNLSASAYAERQQARQAAPS